MQHRIATGAHLIGQNLNAPMPANITQSAIGNASPRRSNNFLHKRKNAIHMPHSYLNRSMQGAAGNGSAARGLVESRFRARPVSWRATGRGQKSLTGFGRLKPARIGNSHWFACQHESGVQPDFVCLAKGLTGGYLPMAATLTTLDVFNDAFLGKYEEFKSFFHGHSFTGNQLGAARRHRPISISSINQTRHDKNWKTAIAHANCNRFGNCRMSAISARSA